MGFKFTKFFTLLAIVYMHSIAFSDNVEHNTLIENNYPMTISKDDPCYQKYKSLPKGAKKLVTCYEEKTAPNHPLNQIKVPSDCYDSNGIFFPVRYIYSHRIGMTRSKFIQPITSSKFRKTNKAFLKYDFNKDKVQDYIFIERTNNSPPILATCISDHATQSWIREQVYLLKGEYEKPIRDIINQHNSANIKIDNTYIKLTSDKHLLIIESHSQNLNPAQPMYGDFLNTREYTYSPQQKGFYLIAETIDDVSSITKKDYIKKMEETRDCSEISMSTMCNETHQKFTSKIKDSEVIMHRKKRLELKCRKIR